VRKLTVLGAALGLLALPGDALGDGEDRKAQFAGQSD